MPRPDAWKDSARCAVEAKPGEFFFPENHSPKQVAEIRAFCAACPVRIQCLTTALDTDPKKDEGWWGGTSRRERMELRARRPLADVCGTAQGWRAHRRAGEEPCDACIAARAIPERMTDPKPSKRQRVIVTSKHCGTYSGYQWHRRRREAACDACLEANREQTRRYRSVGGAA